MNEYIEPAQQEIIQRRDEGVDVSQWDAECRRLVDSEAGLAEWKALYEALYAEPYNSDDTSEPSTLERIRELRPDTIHNLEVDENELSDKTLGAWQGRIAGCILGAVVEGKPKEYIDEYLRAAGIDDLTGFFPRLETLPEGFDEPWLRSERIENSVDGHITYAIRDDDIDYSILGLHYVERYGPGFTPENVADEWLFLLPYYQIFTAERVAYRNLVNGIRPPESAIFRNPYREWIGAQIRADAFGYVNAGNPLAAADMAFRDACISHTRNGIYGEMWSAAMIASAFAVEEPRQAVEIGLNAIPRDCRLADALRKTLRWSAQYPTWQACRERAMEDFGQLHWVHTINNAVWVAIGLLYGEGDFGKSISIAVRCGHDTDCNGATVGSVMGAVLGSTALPDRWTKPFNNTVRSFVTGFDNSRITDLAARTLAQYHRTKAAHGHP